MTITEHDVALADLQLAPAHHGDFATGRQMKPGAAEARFPPILGHAAFPRQAVDDATGKAASALFCEHENTRDYFLLMRSLIQRYGIPVALYTDRHSVFKHIPISGQSGSPTPFSRAMDELGIQMIFALSPQAKGRVERTTGTFQDRLVTELRLSGATTIEDANVVLKAFLDRFNERFGVPAQEPEVSYRPVDTGTCLDRVLCFKHSRRVAKDNTVKYRWSTLQLLPGTERPSYAGLRVDVLEGLDGQLVVEHEGRIVPSQEAPPRSGILRSINGHIESFNGKFRDECLNLRWFLDLEDARVTIAEWRTDYNRDWPHSVLGYMTPLDYRQDMDRNLSLAVV